MKPATPNRNETNPAALEAIGNRELETIEGGIYGAPGIPGTRLPIGNLPQPIPPFRDVFKKYTIGRN